ARALFESAAARREACSHQPRYGKEKSRTDVAPDGPRRARRDLPPGGFRLRADAVRQARRAGDCRKNRGGKIRSRSPRRRRYEHARAHRQGRLYQSAIRETLKEAIMADIRGVGKPITYSEDNPIGIELEELRAKRKSLKREPKDGAERELLGRWLG